MKANMRVLTGIVVLMVLSGISAQATIASPGEVSSSSRMTSRETLANYANFFRNTIARPSLIKLTSPTAVTEPKTSQIDLTNVDGGELVNRIAVMNSFPIGDSFKHVSGHEVFSGVILTAHTKMKFGHPLTPEERKLVAEILKY